MSSTHFPPAATTYPLSFHAIAGSFALSKNLSPLESSKSRLFLQNTRGGGTRESPSFGINKMQPLSRAPVDSKGRSEEHTSELQSHLNLVCRLLLEKKKQ